MRTIKFRGKLCHSKQWIEGNLIIAKDGNPYIIPSNFLEPDGHHLIIDSDNPFWVIPESVGQFTGLTDKNGVEIYEGDILSICNGSINGKNWMDEGRIVKYDNARFNIPNLGYYDSTHWIEVIGNIHTTE